MIIFGIREKCEPGEGQHLDSQHSVEKKITIITFTTCYEIEKSSFFCCWKRKIEDYNVSKLGASVLRLTLVSMVVLYFD